MATDPDLMAAMQSAHDAEATASEKWHKQEHQWKQGVTRYPGLGCFFDHQHKKAYKRQHTLRGEMMKRGGTVETNLGDTSYTDDVKDALTQACDTYDGLSDAYRGVLKAAKDAGDTEAREKFHGVLKKIQKLYHRGEQKQQQLKDLGESQFLAAHLKPKK